MYVEFLNYTSGHKEVVCTLRLVNDQVVIEGQLPTSIQPDVKLLQDKAASPTAFLQALPSAFSGSYLRANLVNKDFIQKSFSSVLKGGVGVRLVPSHFDSVLKSDPGHAGRPGHIGGSAPKEQGQVLVGITSAGKQLGAQANARDVEKSMYEFADQLKSLPGVKNPKVYKGRGIFFGFPEATWVVKYEGNGEAYKLLAATGKKYNQDAVLIMRPGDTDSLVELTFDGTMSYGRRDHILAEVTKQGLSGGTWFRNNTGQTVLRMASVKAWGGDKETHLKATKTLSERLAGIGITNKMLDQGISTEVIDRDHYDDVLNGVRTHG